MKRALVATILLSVLGMTTILVTSFVSPSAEADGRRGFSERDIRGDYSVAFDGEITEGPLVGHAVAVGRVRSDGRGNFVFSRTLNVNGTTVLRQRGSCTYSVNRDGTGTADCTVRTAGQPNTMETFAFTIVNRREVEKQSRSNDDD